jgi:hypothetical protein
LTISFAFSGQGKRSILENPSFGVSPTHFWMSKHSSKYIIKLIVMKTLYTLIAIFSTLFISKQLFAQCDLTASIPIDTIICGECINLNAFGEGQGVSIFTEDFNSGAPTGWAFTQQATFTNPCSPSGVDGTTHIWMGNNSGVPRVLETQTYNLTAATAGVTICFDMLFSEQGDAAPCEGPDEPDEGVYLQYSTDGGATWVDIHYFDPNGGNDPTLVNWNNWCFALPAAAITANTAIRWFQDNDSGADYDHWGIDNVNIYFNDPTYNITWTHDSYSYGVGNSGGTNPNAVCPTTTTTYNVSMTNGITSCTDAITVNVKDPTFRISAEPDTTICVGECVNLNAEATVVVSPGGIKTYENNQLTLVTSGVAAVNINITDLNQTNILPGAIQEVCINQFNYSGTQLCTNIFGGCNCNGTTISFGDACELDVSSFAATLTAPDGCEIILVPVGMATDTQYQNVCFVPSGGTTLGPGFPASGQWNPDEAISNLDGCQANGVWTLEFNAGAGLGFGFGTFFGWNITFDDPEISYPATYSWTPTTGMTGGNTLTPNVCPPQTSGTAVYQLQATDANNCVTVAESVNINMDGCLLPLGLESFEGEAEAQANRLDWNLGEGHSSTAFVLERSLDGFSNFERIAEIPMQLAKLNYSYWDEEASGENYYRLRLRQTNGEEYLSPIIYLEREKDPLRDLNTYWIGSDLQLEFNALTEGATEIRLYNILGQPIKNKMIESNIGMNREQLSLLDLAAGHYILVIQKGANRLQRRIVKH